MLEELTIENLILVESMTVPFVEGLNVLTGETGSGKSAILQALSLLGGQRADLSIIRQGANQGSAQAVFRSPHHSKVLHLLENAGVTADPTEPLIIKREIHASKRGRAWINHQLVQLPLLKELSTHLFEIVNQYANQQLFSSEYQRYMLDLFGNLTKEVESFSLSWNNEKRTKKELQMLQKREAERLRTIDRLQAEIKELTKANIQEDEEETLFAEYSRLTHVQEIHEKIDSLSSLLSENSLSVLSTLREQKQLLEHLASLDSSLNETTKQFHDCVAELDEIAYSIRGYSQSLELKPNRITEINNRLSLIEKIKRKYGQSFNEINDYLVNAEEQLKHEENSEWRIEALEKEALELLQENNRYVKALTEKRNEVAKVLSQRLSEELQLLNMPHAELLIIIKPQTRNSYGDDQIEFLIKPNLGEEFLPLRDCASGGELSRILLALKKITARKMETASLIFDEIDANIGGETAKIVGENLKTISENGCQILCITHFAQVAYQADRHFLISKQEHKGRTKSLLQVLSQHEKSQEIKRMQGNLAFEKV